MCITASALLIASTAVSAAGVVAQGAQQRKMGKYQAAQAEADAQAEAGAGRVMAERFRRAGLQQRAEARAAFARSGVSIDNGTPLEIDRRISEDHERDALTAMYDREGVATQLRARGQAARIGGDQAFDNALLSATSTAMRGWGGYQQSMLRADGTQPAPIEQRTFPRWASD